MPDPHRAQLIHQFLTGHPVGKAIAQHTRYGPGHPVHDMHAGGPQAQQSPTMMQTPQGPMNPMLMQQLMAMHPGAGGPGAPPLPMPQQAPPPGPAPQMPGQGGM